MSRPDEEQSKGVGRVLQSVKPLCGAKAKAQVPVFKTRIGRY